MQNALIVVGALAFPAAFFVFFLRKNKEIAADTWESHVFPHGPVRKIAANVLEVTGSLPHVALPRNMHVWRHPKTGAVIIHSAVCLDEQGMRMVDEFTGGRRCDVLIVPNSFHRTDAAMFAARYPEAKVVCPDHSRISQSIKSVVRVDATLPSNSTEHALNELDVKIHAAAGPFPGYTYELPLEGGGQMLLACDGIFNVAADFPVESRVKRFILHHITKSVGFFGVGRIGRLFGFLGGTNGAVKAWFLEQSARNDIAVVAMAHGDHVAGVETCKAKLRQAGEAM